jgi:hypothetical protein
MAQERADLICLAAEARNHNFHIRYKFKGGPGHTITDKSGEVIAKGDFCTKLVLPFLLTDGTNKRTPQF